MTRNHVFTTTGPALVLLLALAGVAATLPGGFLLQVDIPRNVADDVVLHVRADGCHQPAKAKVAGTAEGIVDGERRSLPLTLTKVGKGIYSITQQWPAEGTWILAFAGSYRGRLATTLVTLGTDGRVAMQQTASGDAPSVRMFSRKLSDRDIESALQ